MSKKKGKKKNTGPPQALVRLSQVMIVKNEEKNIGQALRWGRGTAFEQIVVDTGSTDRTVEIAKKMGAKIFHFEWVNDFSAAKNFAIEQASGNWIAFLDADEYFTDVNVKKLMVFLKRIMNDPQMRADYHVINCDWVNVDEEGNRMSVQDQERIFRNLPNLRYIGTIHERLDVSKENIVLVDEIEIIHTGYSETALKETNKAARNVELLRIELEKAPHDLNIKAYLADSLKMSEHQSDQEEADSLFMEVIENGGKVIPDLLKKAYIHYIKKNLDNPDKADECRELCEKARRAIPGDSELENIIKQTLDNIKDVPATAQQTKSKLAAQLSALNQSQQPAKSDLSAQLAALNQSQQPAKSDLSAQLSALKQSAGPAAAKPSAQEINKSPEEQEPPKLSQGVITNEFEQVTQDFLKNGEELFDMGQLDELAEICQEFLASHPDDRVYAMLSSVQYALGNVSEAEKAARLGLNVSRENPDLLYNMACILQSQGKYSNSLRYYERARKFGDEELENICADEIANIENTAGISLSDLVPQKAQKRALIIAAVYPPRAGSGVQRTVKLVKYLRFFGWEPVVVTFPLIGNSSALFGYSYFDELPDDIEVHIFPFVSPDGISCIERMKSKLVSMLSEKTKAELENLYDNADISRKSQLCSFPESQVSWAYDVAETIDQHVNMDSIDLIYSTSGPYLDHFAAYFMKQNYNKPWVADFRDEWSNNPIIWSGKDTLNYRMCLDCEKKILENADKVICTAELSVDNYLRLGVPESKIACITNGYDEEDFEGIFDGISRNEKFTLVHNGILYGNRTPFAILTAIRNLIDNAQISAERIVFRIGSFTYKKEEEELKAALEKLGLNDIVLISPYMEHHQSLKLAAAADLLVLILTASPESKALYTGKIFEYLRFGKPVLCLGPKGSVSDILLEKAGLGANAEFEDVKAIEEVILRNYQTWLANPQNTIPLVSDKMAQNTEISAYERKNLTAKHAAAFNEAAKGN